MSGLDDVTAAVSRCSAVSGNLILSPGCRQPGRGKAVAHFLLCGELENKSSVYYRKHDYFLLAFFSFFSARFSRNVFSDFFLLSFWASRPLAIHFSLRLDDWLMRISHVVMHKTPDPGPENGAGCAWRVNPHSRPRESAKRARVPCAQGNQTTTHPREPG